MRTDRDVMARPPPGRVALLFLALLAPPAAADDADAICRPVSTAATVAFQDELANIAQFRAQWGMSGGACPGQQDVIVDAHAGAGTLAGLVTILAEIMPGLPALPHAPSGATFEIQFEIAIAPACDDPQGSIFVDADGARSTVPLDRGVVGALCGLHVPSVGDAGPFVGDLLQAVAFALATAAPGAEGSLHAAASLAATTAPSSVSVAGLHADLPRADTQDGHVSASGAARGAIEPTTSVAPLEVGAPRAPAPEAADDATEPPPNVILTVPLGAPAPTPTRATPPAPVPPPTPPPAASERHARFEEHPSPEGSIPSLLPGRHADADRPVASAAAVPARHPRDAPPGPAREALALVAGVGLSALAAAALSLYQRIARPRALEHPLRERLHAAALARAEPATAGDLARELGIGRKTAEHHLLYLARLSLLGVVRDGAGVARYHDPSRSPAPMCKPVAEALYLLVRERPGLSTREAAGALGLTRPRAERSLRELAREGRIETSLAEGERRFYVSSG